MKNKEIALLEALFQELKILGTLGNLNPSTGDFDYSTIDQRGRLNLIEFKKMIPLRKRQILEIISYYHLIKLSETNFTEKLWLVILVDVDLAHGRERLVPEIEEFINKHHIEIGVILVSLQYQFKVIGSGKPAGRIHSNVGFLDALKLKTKSFEQKRKEHISFSPNQQWLLKYLLLNGIDRKYWDMGKFEDLSMSTSLSRASGIAQSACYDLLKSLENLGYLVIEKNNYRLRNLKKLIQQWSQRYNKQGVIELFAKPRDPSISIERYWHIFSSKWIENTTNTYSAIFSGTPATANYSLRVSNDFNLIIHTSQGKSGDLNLLFKEFQLVQCETISSIKVILHETNKPALEALKNIGKRAHAPAFVDPIQLALDISHFGARGEEHAEKIYNKILYPFWARNEWGL